MSNASFTTRLVLPALLVFSKLEKTYSPYANCKFTLKGFQFRHLSPKGCKDYRMTDGRSEKPRRGDILTSHKMSPLRGSRISTRYKFYNHFIPSGLSTATHISKLSGSVVNYLLLCLTGSFTNIHFTAFLIVFSMSPDAVRVSVAPPCQILLPVLVSCILKTSVPSS